MPLERVLAGFASERSEKGFVIHIVDDAGEVFEIEASRENVELIVQNLQAALASSAPASPPLSNRPR